LAAVLVAAVGFLAEDFELVFAEPFLAADFVLDDAVGLGLAMGLEVAFFAAGFAGAFFAAAFLAGLVAVFRAALIGAVASLQVLADVRRGTPRFWGVLVPRGKVGERDLFAGPRFRLLLAQH
jgi:hypothetical protein